MLMRRSVRISLCSVCLVLCAVFSAHADLPADSTRPIAVGDETPSDEYSDLVDEAVKALVDGDAPRFKGLLSKKMLAHNAKEMGEEAIDKIIKERFIPFFTDFARLEPITNVTKTQDAFGNKGLVFYRTLRTTEGERRPFAIFIIDEDGTLVVGNLLPNKTMSDIVADRPSAK